jgi:hypothetical protein
VRDVIETAGKHAEHARIQYKAGTGMMPIDVDEASVSVMFGGRKLILEDISGGPTAGAHPVVVIRTGANERCFRLDDDDDNWREISCGSVVEGDAPGENAPLEQGEVVFADYQDPVLAWDGALEDLLADLRPPHDDT